MVILRDDLPPRPPIPPLLFTFTVPAPAPVPAPALAPPSTLALGPKLRVVKLRRFSRFVDGIEELDVRGEVVKGGGGEGDEEERETERGRGRGER